MIIASYRRCPIFSHWSVWTEMHIQISGADLRMHLADWCSGYTVDLLPVGIRFEYNGRVTGCYNCSPSFYWFSYQSPDCYLKIGNENLLPNIYLLTIQDNINLRIMMILYSREFWTIKSSYLSWNLMISYSNILININSNALVWNNVDSKQLILINFNPKFMWVFLTSLRSCECNAYDSS